MTDLDIYDPTKIRGIIEAKDATIASVEAQLNQLKSIINYDGSLTEWSQFVDIAQDMRAALNAVPVVENENEKLMAELAQERSRRQELEARLNDKIDLGLTRWLNKE